MKVEAFSKCLYSRSGALCRRLGIGVDQRQQGVGQACQVPLRNRRLIAIGIAARGVNRAEYGPGVEVF